jgi:hypothetical protein
VYHLEFFILAVVMIISIMDDKAESRKVHPAPHWHLINHACGRGFLSASTSDKEAVLAI